MGRASASTATAPGNAPRTSFAGEAAGPGAETSQPRTADGQQPDGQQPDGQRPLGQQPDGHCLYEGTVRHRRFAPRPHSFQYRVFFPLLDLGQLDTAFSGHPLWSSSRPNLVWLRREDYHGDPEQPLAAAIGDAVVAEGLPRPERTYLLTHPRYLGIGFNPVSFYFCYAAGRFQALLAEVSNTPWGERRLYVLERSAARSQGTHHSWRFQKDFHVSPFMSMNQQYRWSFSEPGPSLRVHMDNVEGERKLFDATMKLRRLPLDNSQLSRMLFSYPPMTLKVFGAIYWQALRLTLKRIPYFPHPKTYADDARLPRTPR